MPTAVKSAIREELRPPATVFVKRAVEEVVVNRFVLDQVFDLMDLMGDEENGLGDALDLFTGKVNTDDLREVSRLSVEAANLRERAMEVPDEKDSADRYAELINEAADLDAQAETLKSQVVSSALNLKAIFQTVAKKRDVFYALLGLGLNKPIRWIGENLDMEEMVDTLYAIVNQEMTSSFFVKIQSFGKLWETRKAEMGSATPTPGSGVSLPS